MRPYNHLGDEEKKKVGPGPGDYNLRTVIKNKPTLGKSPQKSMPQLRAKEKAPSFLENLNVGAGSRSS